MSPPSPAARRSDPNSAQGFQDERWGRVEALADQFEAQWSPDEPRMIEKTLAGAAPSDRYALLRALIVIDADRRRAAALPVAPSLYLERFDKVRAGDAATKSAAATKPAAAPGPAFTESEVASLIAPHLPTTICPRDLTLDDAARSMVMARVRRVEDPPLLPRHLRIDPGYGSRGLLGRGGMGAVWAARDLRRTRKDPHGRAVAVKVLLPRAAADSLLLARFAREAAILKMFGDPAIPQFRDYRPPTPEADAHIVTDLIGGETFERLLESRRQGGRAGCDASGTGNGRLRMFRKGVAAVARAHAVGLIHRDLKPSNLMVSRPDERGRRRVFLLDFGMAWMPGLPADPCDENGCLAGSAPEELPSDDASEPAEDSKLHDPEASAIETDNYGFTVILDDPAVTRVDPSVTQVDLTEADTAFSDGGDHPDAGPRAPRPRPVGATRAYDGGTASKTLIGSPPYMAPEQALRRRVGPAADVYSLGLILVEILTGEQARDGVEAGAVVEKARSGDLAAAIDRLGLCAARSELIDLALRCTCPDPGARPADAGEMLAELDALCVRDPRTRARAWDPRTVALVQGRRLPKEESAAARPSASSPRQWLRAAAETLFGGSPTDGDSASAR